jgi:Co/Zn/Cd efflux system component
LVIGINAVMFFVEMGAGALAGSRALQADALDFFGDTLTSYDPRRDRNGSASSRVGRLREGRKPHPDGSVGPESNNLHVLIVGAPRAEVMGVVGLLALAANLASVLILMRYREGDANVRSVWLCSRNDAIGNVAVMLAALGVWLTGTRWPDLIVAALMAGVFVTSSVQILRQALGELRSVEATT